MRRFQTELDVQYCSLYSLSTSLPAGRRDTSSAPLLPDQVLSPNNNMGFATVSVNRIAAATVASRLDVKVCVFVASICYLNRGDRLRERGVASG